MISLAIALASLLNANSVCSAFDATEAYTQAAGLCGADAGHAACVSNDLDDAMYGAFLACRRERVTACAATADDAASCMEWCPTSLGYVFKLDQPGQVCPAPNPCTKHAALRDAALAAGLCAKPMRDGSCSDRAMNAALTPIWLSCLDYSARLNRANGY